VLYLAPSFINMLACLLAKVCKFLKARGVIVAERFGRLRCAPHLYNTDDDINLLCQLLEEHAAQPAVSPS
jgi:selenocysteine lyase/cysteine desulfurase